MRVGNSIGEIFVTQKPVNGKKYKKKKKPKTNPQPKEGTSSLKKDY